MHHHDFDEAFYVIEGELTFQLWDELFTRKAGAIVCAPAGVERYFARMAAERRDGGQ